MASVTRRVRRKAVLHSVFKTWGVMRSSERALACLYRALGPDVDQLLISKA